MKKLTILFSILLFGVFTKAQLLKVEYDLIRNTTITGNKDFSEAFKEKILKDEKKPEKYVLYFSEGDSFFKSLPTEVITHEKETSNEAGGTLTMVEVASKQEVKVYKSKKENRLYSYRNVDGNEFYKVVPFHDDVLDFQDEKEKIDEFVCRSVIVTKPSGNRIKVWYTEELPISAGPFGYTDFPGLVLKVETPTFVIYATRISNNFDTQEIEPMNGNLEIVN